MMLNRTLATLCFLTCSFYSILAFENSDFLQDREKYVDKYYRNLLLKNNNISKLHFIDFDESMKLSLEFDLTYSKHNKNWLIIKDLYNDYILKSKKIDLSVIRIPKIIHFIWLGSPIPERYKKHIQTFKDKHTDWEIRVWTDADVASFNLKNKTAFEATYNWGEKSDIWRYEILERLGGVYVDCDIECIQSFDILHHTCDFYTSAQYDVEARLYNGLIGARAHHPILKKCVENIVPVNGMMYWLDIMKRTGPFYFTDIFFQSLAEEKTNDSNVVFPLTFFYPLPNIEGHKIYPATLEKSFSFCLPESFAIHYWDGSWVKGAPQE